MPLISVCHLGTLKRVFSDDLTLKPILTFAHRWAVSSVMTRQNQIPTVDGSRVTLALIPLWDMCNHTNGLVKSHTHTQNEDTTRLASPLSSI